MIETKDCWMRDGCKKFLENSCNDSSFCLKLFKLDSLFNDSLLTNSQRNRINLRLDSSGADREEFKYLKEIETHIEEFVASGENLYIHSSQCGNGKTAWSIRLMQSYFNTIWFKSDLNCRGLFINIPRFLLTLKDSISNSSEYIDHIKKNVLSADLVIWDEIGSKIGTQFEIENLLSLINTRLDCKKSNIYTSNLTPIELKEKIGDRLYSRICNYSKDIEFFGLDKRGL